MRVSNQTLFLRTQEGIQKTTQRLAQLQEAVASGKRINDFADDPLGAVRAFDLRAFAASLEQYDKNINAGLPFLKQNDATLGEVVEVVGRAKELALQMANDSNSAQDRQLAANEVRRLFEHLLSLANTKIEDRYLFGGFKNGSAPFTAGVGVVTYNGDGGQIAIPASTSHMLTLNLPGDQVFQGVGVAGGVDIFAVFLDLETALSANDVTGVDGINTQIGRLDTALDQILGFRVEVGGRINAATTTQESVGLMQTQTQIRRGEIEGADVFQLYADFARAQHAFAAALQSAARVTQTSLLDFLR
jgi:flagellar hook-associated protein 3 FlgL